MLLADEAGATLIVTVGMRFSLVEFLDKGRSGMASAVLTRIRVADKIVDAKGVSRLYQSRISARALILLALAALVTFVVAVLRCRWATRSWLPRRPADPAAGLANWTLLVIDFRYHLVSIIAVFLALAIGIVVGSTALQPTVESGLQRDRRPLSPAHRPGREAEHDAEAAGQRGPGLRPGVARPGCSATCSPGRTSSWSPRPARTARW